MFDGSSLGSLSIALILVAAAIIIVFLLIIQLTESLTYSKVKRNTILNSNLALLFKTLA